MPKENTLLTKSVLKVFLLLGSIALLYLGGSLLVPLVVAGLLALMLNPIHSWLIGKGWSIGLATGGSLFVLLLFFAGIFLAVGTQGARFVEELPQIKEKVLNKYEEYKGQLVEAGGGEANKEKKKVEPNNSSGEMISASQASQVLGKISGVAGNFLLMLVYVALLLSQKERLREFLLRRTPDSQRKSTKQALNDSRDIAQNYLRARLILIAILTVLYSVGFLLAGLDYAIVIALLAATLSIIPYVGNIIGGVIALALSMTGEGGGSEQVWAIVITMSVAQLLESYVLTPLIVGKEVSINPLTTIIAVVGFNILWGPVGAIVAIPITAILKIICEHVDGLNDYAYLLGDD